MKYAIIGNSLIKVIVNKSIPVKKLSKDQLKGIFTGKFTNWKEVGGGGHSNQNRIRNKNSRNEFCISNANYG